MPTPKVLDARVVGASAALPAHPRVELPNLGSLLSGQSPAQSCIDIAATFSSALQQLETARPEALLVIEGGRLLGLFSAMDVLRAIRRYGTQMPERPLRDAITPCSVFAAPGDSLQHGQALIRDNDQPFLPILADGEVAGLVSLSDLLAAIAMHYEKVFKAQALDQQILFLRGTYSC